MVGHTGERGIVPGLVLHVSCSLRTQVVPCRLRQPSHFWAPCADLSLLWLRAAAWEGRSGSLDAWRGAGVRGGTGRDWCGTSASVPHPAALRRSWLAEISAGSLFFVPSSRGLLLSHMLLLKLLCSPLLPSLLPPPSSLQCTHLTPLQTHGPIVSSAPFLALWFPDEAS